MRFHFAFCWQSILMSEWITPTKGSKCIESRVVEMHLGKCIVHIFKLPSLIVISIENEQRHGPDFVQNFIKWEESFCPQYI